MTCRQKAENFGLEAHARLVDRHGKHLAADIASEQNPQARKELQRQAEQARRVAATLRRRKN